MNLAVRLYGDLQTSEKPEGIPDAWPAQIIELGESTTLPNDGHEWQLMTCAELIAYKQQYQSEYDTWKSQIDSAANTRKYIAGLIKSAKSFGEDLIIDYAVDNVLSGKTIGQIALIANKMKDIQLLLMSGSLYTAESAMALVELDENITEAIIKKYRNKIREYLGMSLLE